MSEENPLVTPRPVRRPDGSMLGTRRVLVMDYLKGLPLTRALEAMKARGVDPMIVGKLRKSRVNSERSFSVAHSPASVFTVVTSRLSIVRQPPP